MSKMKWFYVSASLFILVNACKEKEANEVKEKSVVSVSVEKLSAAFDSVWNKKDSAAVVNFLTDDAVMIGGRDVIKGKDSLIKNFVATHLPVGNDLKVKFEQTGVDGGLAYESGTWSMQVAIPNKKPFENTGNYTFIWKKQKDDTWKISLMQIDNHEPLK